MIIIIWKNNSSKQKKFLFRRVNFVNYHSIFCFLSLTRIFLKKFCKPLSSTCEFCAEKICDKAEFVRFNTYNLPLYPVLMWKSGDGWRVVLATLATNDRSIIFCSNHKVSGRLSFHRWCLALVGHIYEGFERSEKETERL